MRSVIKSAKSVEEAIDLGVKELGLSKDEVEVEILEQPKKGLFGLLGSKDAMVKITQKFDFKININDIYGKETKEVEEKKVSKDDTADIEKITVKVEKKIKEDIQKVKVVEEVAKKEVITETKNSDIETIKEDISKKLAELLNYMHLKSSVKVTSDKDIIKVVLYDISEEDTGIVIGRKGETLDSIQYILSLIANKDTNDFYRVTLDVANYRERRKDAIENNAKKVAFKVLKSKKSIALEPMNAYERRIVHYALQNYKELETVSQGSFPNRKVIIKYKG
ncbi:MAG: RNA-binding cell elongation regulator Jag/EloR [Tissierellia bacterium]|nr:RNA-binding cell elongation regulator Jag/EloR [Tissierellia bacterium]